MQPVPPRAVRLARLLLILGVVGVLGALGAGSVARPAEPDAATILKKADEVRNPSHSFRLKVRVSTAGEDATELDVSIKGKDKTFLKTLAPARDRGRDMLMLGEDMWLALPKAKKPVRISLNQKLTGQAANGDISRQRWAGDYVATIERVDGDAWVLLLEAARPKLTYDKIRLWVAKAAFHPLKAEYLTKGGKTLKRATFGGYKKLAGATRPTETVITDALDAGKKSTITILEMETADFPDALFNQNSLK
jgi:outer membrane lipoprotein-sorting protein